MKAKTKINIGLTVAVIVLIYYGMGTIGTLMLTCLMPQSKFIFGTFFLLHLIPLAFGSLYVFSLIKKRLSLAKWSYYILAVCILLSAIVFVFKGLFVKETSEGLISYTTLLILIISIPVFLFLFCLGFGIRGLKKYLAEQITNN